MEFPSVSAMLEPGFGIPTDVTFKIMENLGHGVESDKVVGEITGHKMILGLCSEVFRRQFFGEARDKEDTVPVKQTTKAAFGLMLDFIYNKEVRWDSLSVDELFNVANLAEKYFMSPLMEKVKSMFKEFPMTLTTVMELASSAAEYEQFPDITLTLLQACARFLARNLNSKADLLHFFASQAGGGQEILAMRLMAMVKDLSSEIPWAYKEGWEMRARILLQLLSAFESGELAAPYLESAKMNVIELTLRTNTRKMMLKIELPLGYPEDLPIMTLYTLMIPGEGAIVKKRKREQVLSLERCCYVSGVEVGNVVEIVRGVIGQLSKKG